MPIWAAWLGGPLSRVYGAAVARRNLAFEGGRGVMHGGVPVISVGNLSVGGTGKTPMVMLLAQALRREGRRPAVLLRGYRARERDGKLESDEAEEYRRALARADAGAVEGACEIPVIVNPERGAALAAYLASPEGRSAPIDCAILDDGFQHRRLARDLDIVLVDATRSPFTDSLLPAGWLREPVESLRRALGVVVMHAESVTEEELAELETEIARSHGLPAIAVTRHVWGGLHSAQLGEHLGVGWLRGKRVVGACAIGNPGPFLCELSNHADVRGTVVRRDHDSFGAGARREIRELARRHKAQVIVVTEKDWSKLKHVAVSEWPCPLVRPVLEIAFDRGSAELRAMVLGAAGAPARPTLEST
ncbi:MAG: tetraacyldisaccharide 4'-kinase [Phycisphaerales bacterium]|nr:tetraacyldisaccharide 4'-kinase [Phycisphaerales bacterium]